MIGGRGDPVLVLEDSDEDFDSLQEALGRAGFQREVRRAVTGEECLALLRCGEGGGGRPALVLLDLNVPGLDGREALREIKQDPVLKVVPVVVLTTSANPRDLELCYRQGANAYHVKPLPYPAYLEQVEQLLRYWLGSVVPLSADRDL